MKIDDERRLSVDRNSGRIVLLVLVWFLLSGRSLSAQSRFPVFDEVEVNDTHFHLTNYDQQGPDIHTFLNLMDTKVGSVALFAIPPQQGWSYQTSGEFAPAYLPIAMSFSTITP